MVATKADGKGESVSIPSSAVFAINYLTMNFRAIKHNAKEVCAAREKPLKGVYKLNVDTSFHVDATGCRSDPSTVKVRR
jgi:hypothetical protein